MTITHRIHSRKTGRAIVFVRYGNVILVNLTGQDWAAAGLGGTLDGPEIGYTGNDKAGFSALCRSWYQTYTRKERSKNHA